MKVSMYGLNFQIFEATSAENLMKLVSKFFQEIEAEFIEVPDDEICFLDDDEYISTGEISKDQKEEIDNKNLLIPKIYKFEMKRLPKSNDIKTTLFPAVGADGFYHGDITPVLSKDDSDDYIDYIDYETDDDSKYTYYAYILYK